MDNKPITHHRNEHILSMLCMQPRVTVTCETSSGLSQLHGVHECAARFHFHYVLKMIARKLLYMYMYIHVHMIDVCAKPPTVADYAASLLYIHVDQ